MPASFMRSNQTSPSGGSHCPWIGRSTASFTARALSARIAAPRSRPGGVPVVITMCLTPSSSTAALGDLGELLRRFALDRSARRKRLSDGTELTSLGAALVANAALQHRGRQHVAAVQHRDLPIGNAVGGAEVVKARPHRKAHARRASRRPGGCCYARAHRACRRHKGLRRPARYAPAP